MLNPYGTNQETRQTKISVGKRTRRKQNLTISTSSDVTYLENKSTNTSATHENIFLEELSNSMLKYDVSKIVAIYSSFNQAAQKDNKQD